MTLGRKTGGRDFTKDNYFHSPGRPALSKEARQLQALTKEEHVKIVSELLQYTRKELTALVDNPYSDCHKLMVAKLIARAIMKGDAYTYDKLMDRVIGKVAERYELTGAKGGPIPIEVSDARSRLADRIADIIAARRADGGDKQPK